MKRPSRDPLPLLLGSAVLAFGCASSEEAGDRADLYRVTRGDLSISVTEQAEIRPAVSTRIKSEMEGQSTIIFLVEEGSLVQQGDKLVELDASELLERRAEQEIKVSRADADQLQARKELEIRRKEFESDKLGGENRVRIAEIELEKFLGRLHADGSRDMGEKETALIEARADIDLANAEVKLAENKLAWSRKLFDRGFITKDDLERDEIELQRRQKNLRVAQNELNILELFEHPKVRIERDQQIMEAKTELEGVIARGNAVIAQAEADLDASEKEYELAYERLQNLIQQIENSVIRAPTAGLVVYATEEGRRGQSDVVEEGATVRERQTLIELPDVTRMVAQLKVHEADIDKVQPDQSAEIKVDAFQQLEFRGKVTRVSPVADSGSRWSNNSLKVYKTQVDLDGDNRLLKPGMSATVTILVAELKGVLFVPIHAVQTQGRVNYVWLHTDAGPRAHPVDRGLHDLAYVEIVAGLDEDDVVYLAPPPGAVEPEFEQPPPSAGLPVDDGSPELAGRPVESSADGGERRGGRGMPSGPATDAFQELLARKYPDLAKQAEESPFALRRSDEFATAREQDPELSEAYDAMIEEMRARFGGRRRGGDGERTRGGQGADERR